MGQPWWPPDFADDHIWSKFTASTYCSDTKRHPKEAQTLGIHEAWPESQYQSKQSEESCSKYLAIKRFSKRKSCYLARYDQQLNIPAFQQQLSPPHHC